MKKRKFLFFYLNTGAGHISAARVLTSSMQQRDSNVEIKMVNGLKGNKIAQVFFEKGYNYACNYVRGAFPLFYDLGMHRVFQKMLHDMMGVQTRRYLRKIILEEHPTDIVSFHYAVSPFIQEVLKDIPYKINFTVIVTDPFTVPHVWFYDKNTKYMVYSKEAKDTAIQKCGVPEANVCVVPFLMNEKFKTKYSDSQIRELKIKHGFDPDKKIVLLVGGGEGLPGATEIINECILKRANFSVGIICGRDVVKQRNLKLLSLAYPGHDLKVFGFVDYLDELIKICDCAVIKAGPATLIEALYCRKPVIICKYIHNQELGNMHFAVYNHVGYFIRKPRRIYSKINELLNDTEFDKKMKQNFDSMDINTDASLIADALLSKGN